MKALEQKILNEAKIFPGDVLKVDGFLNHRIDVEFLYEIGKELYSLFKEERINKILTVEASGIGVACVSALAFDPVPSVVFAKKHGSTNIGVDLYSSKAFSYTHQKYFDIVLSKSYLNSDDRVLIIDDFLAKGNALEALIDICSQAGATLCGVGIVIEKAYQGGGDLIRSRGIRVESLAKIKSMSVESGIEFE